MYSLSVCASDILAYVFCFFFKQKTAYEMRISDWSSDVCSSDLVDGDGEPDAVTNGGDEVIVSGAAGELRLARAGGSVGSPGGQTWLGDLDGDGHDEVIVYVTTLPTEGDLDPLVYDLVIVPGSTDHGTHDPADVGVRLPFGVSGPPVLPLGDHA